MGSIGEQEQIQGLSDQQSHPGDKHAIPVYEQHSSFNSLKERITDHYNIASDYYYSLWGQHIHHGLFIPPNISKEEAAESLIKFMVDKSGLGAEYNVLDVGCGIGGTSRYLARNHSSHVTGITISGKQVDIANRLSLSEVNLPSATSIPAPIPIPIGQGSVHFLHLDAEEMLDVFISHPQAADVHNFDYVWISEALSHIPSKPTIFSSSFALLAPHGKLVIADWFRAPDLTPEQIESDIKPIEDGMLLPKLHTFDEYIGFAEDAGFQLVSGPHDLSKDVAKTWDISWSLVSSPSLWTFAISQGRDGLAFLQAFRAMRRGYANGSFRYGVMVFEKP